MSSHSLSQNLKGHGSARTPNAYGVIIGLKKAWFWFLMVLISLVSSCVLPSVAQTSINWSQLKTQYHALYFTDETRGMANWYASWVDIVYLNITNLYGYRPVPPISIYLYPTVDAFVATFPDASRYTWITVKGVYRTKTISICEPRASWFNDLRRKNNMGHELTHIVVGELSGGNIPTGFNEGFATCSEQDFNKQHSSYKNSFVNFQQHYQRGLLLSWKDINDPQKFNESPIRYQEVHSIGTFLIDRYGFDQTKEFVRKLRVNSNYQRALKEVFGKSMDDLEQEWKKYLPQYLDNRHEINFAIQYIDKLKTDAPIHIAEAENTIQKAESERRTVGLNRARTLVQDAKDNMSAGDYVRVKLLADRAKELALEATTP